jgi:hypothetical protein
VLSVVKEPPDTPTKNGVEEALATVAGALGCDLLGKSVAYATVDMAIRATTDFVKVFIVFSFL